MTFVNRLTKPSFFTLNIKALLQFCCLNYISTLPFNKFKCLKMTLLHVIAVHSCKSLPGESKQTNHFLRMKPNVFFPFSKATTRLGNSMSAHQAEAYLLANRFYTQNLFACRAMWRTFKILTSYSITELRTHKVGMAPLSNRNQKTNMDLRPAF